MSGCVLNLSTGICGTFINWIKGGAGFGPNIANINQFCCPVTAPPSGELSANAWRMQLNLPATATYSGHWVLKFQGTGGFKITSDGATLTQINTTGTVTGSGTNAITLAGTNCRLEFSTTATGGVWFGQFLGGVSYSGMKGPALVRLTDEVAYDAGETINPDYVTAIKALNPIALRMMQWGGVSNIETASSLPFTHMPSADYLTWGTGTSQNYNTASLVGGTTFAGTNNYTCSAAPGTPVSITAGEQVWGIVTNSNTSQTMTLNIGGRGSKPVLRFSGGLLAVGEVIGGGYGTFVYDPITDAYLYSNDNPATTVPISQMVALCNEVGCALWYNFCVITPDAEITLITQYIRDNLNSNLTAYFEWGNELWGGVPMPSALNNTWAALNSTGFAQMQGYKVRNTAGLVTAAWAPRSMSTLQRVTAFQAFGSISGFQNDCLNGSTFALMTSLGWDTAPNRPVDFTDVLAYAPYYQGPNTPAFQGDGIGNGGYGNSPATQAQLYAAADNYASGNSALMNQALDFVDNDVRQGTGGNGDTNCLIDYLSRSNIYASWETLAASYDGSRTTPLKILCYEGGLQINAPTTGTLSNIGVSTAYSAKIATLFAAYKNDARCKRLVAGQFRDFILHKHSVAPSWYEYVGQLDQWSSHPGDLYSTPYQSVNAMAQFGAPATPGKGNLKGGF